MCSPRSAPIASAFPDNERTTLFLGGRKWAQYASTNEIVAGLVMGGQSV